MIIIIIYSYYQSSTILKYALFTFAYLAESYMMTYMELGLKSWLTLWPRVPLYFSVSANWGGISTAILQAVGILKLINSITPKYNHNMIQENCSIEMRFRLLVWAIPVHPQTFSKISCNINIVRVFVFNLLNLLIW